MHIERVPNRNSPPAVLLRQSYREGGRVRKRTLANLSKLPDNSIEGLRVLLKGGTAITSLEDAFEIQRSLPHGLAPLLFEDEESTVVSPEDSVVVPVKRNVTAKSKAQTKRTSQNLPVHSFRTLLTDLSTIVKNRVQPRLPGVSVSCDKITTPTPLQQRALNLLGVSLIM